jgi:hypothetical protein
MKSFKGFIKEEKLAKGAFSGGSLKSDWKRTKQDFNAGRKEVNKEKRYVYASAAGGLAGGTMAGGPALGAATGAALGVGNALGQFTAGAARSSLRKEEALGEMHASPSGMVGDRKPRKDKGMAAKSPTSTKTGTVIGALAGNLLTRSPKLKIIGTAIGAASGAALGAYQNTDKARRVRYKAMHDPNFGKKAWAGKIKEEKKYAGRVLGTLGGATVGGVAGHIAGGVVGAAVSRHPVGMVAGAALGNIAGQVTGAVKGYKWGKKIDTKSLRKEERKPMTNKEALKAVNAYVKKHKV